MLSVLPIRVTKEVWILVIDFWHHSLLTSLDAIGVVQQPVLLRKLLPEQPDGLP